jgi:hypothetical protein
MIPSLETLCHELPAYRDWSLISGPHPEHGQWKQVAVVKATSTDGFDVTIEACAMPTVFVRLRWSGMEAGFGSGCCELAEKMATAIAAGMLGVKKKEPS